MQELLCQAAGSLPHPSSRLMIHKRPMKVKDSLKCLLSAGIPKEAEGRVIWMVPFVVGYPALLGMQGRCVGGRKTACPAQSW